MVGFGRGPTAHDGRIAALMSDVIERTQGR